MGTIRKRGEYQFQAQVRRQGYEAQSATFETRKDAEKWVRATERDMDTGTFIPRGEAMRTTIAELAERYLNEERVKKMRGLRQEEQRVNTIIVKFGKYNLSAVSPSMVAEWARELSNTLKPQTVKHYLSVLGRLYKAATLDFGIPLPLGNPVDSVRKPSVNNDRERILSADEHKRLFAALDKSRSKHLKRVVIIALETAMRRGEILSLTWQNIIDEKLAYLPKTKNGDSRTVPLTDKALDVLKVMKNLPRNIDGKIFKMSLTAVTEGFQRVVEHAEIEDFHFHDLRHCAVSRFAKVLQIHELAKMVGHKDLRSVMRYYKKDDNDILRKLNLAA